jgi:hypothetical protein
MDKGFHIRLIADNSLVAYTQTYEHGEHNPSEVAKSGSAG